MRFDNLLMSLGQEGEDFIQYVKFHVTFDLKGYHIYSQKKKPNYSKFGSNINTDFNQNQNQNSGLLQNFRKLWDQLSKVAFPRVGLS